VRFLRFQTTEYFREKNPPNRTVVKRLHVGRAGVRLVRLLAVNHTTRDGPGRQLRLITSDPEPIRFSAAARVRVLRRVNQKTKNDIIFRDGLIIPRSYIIPVYEYMDEFDCVLSSRSLTNGGEGENIKRILFITINFGRGIFVDTSSPENIQYDTRKSKSYLKKKFPQDRWP